MASEDQPLPVTAPGAPPFGGRPGSHLAGAADAFGACVRIAAKVNTKIRRREEEANMGDSSGKRPPDNSASHRDNAGLTN